nr:uncharacterized protein LOC129272031 [Lytechinus pictus]
MPTRKYSNRVWPTPLQQIDSSLTNRHQQVVLQVETSEKCDVTSGVPQGTVLGLLLFLAYINDLPSGMYSNVQLFADDYCTLPMWDFVSPEDNEVLIDKFRTESKKVIDRWSLGNASTNEKDAAVSFLVQLGAVRITFQSSSDHIQSGRRVSVQFEDRPLLETEHGGSDTADPPPMKNEDIGSREQSGALTSASQASSYKDVPIDCGLETKHDGPDTADPPLIKNEDINSREQSGALTSASQAVPKMRLIDCGDDGDNENYSAWMSEPSDDDDDDDTVTAKEDDRSATQQPSEEHPCPSAMPSYTAPGN